ncbi:MAG TPA: glycosyltransferase family 87 protein [Gemmatimonadales bacterium]|nr:glycosyltransferase family 87 protein [Gemmatimonadales bacterium]
MIPRDCWPRFRSPTATRVAIAGVYALVLLLTVIEVARSVARGDRLDYSYYPQLGEAVLAGTDPYTLPFTSWPPGFLLLGVAIALASRMSAIATLAVWQLGSVLAAWGTLKLLAKWFDPEGGQPSFWPRSPDRLAFVSAPILAPFLLAIRPFQDNVLHGQINTQLLFLSLFAFERFRTGRAVSGGVALALAATLKAVPVLLVGYFVYKRAWRAVGWTVAFLVLLNVVIPVGIFGAGAVAHQWHAWRAVVGAEMLVPAAHHPNQALLSAMKRYLSIAGTSDDPIHVTLASLSTAGVVRLFWIVAWLGALGLAAAFWRNPRDLSDPRCAGEVAICVAAMTLVSPIAWIAHFVTVVAPAALVCAGLRRLPRDSARRRYGWVLWWAAFACLTFSASAWVGWTWAERLESLSVITLAGLILVGLGVSLLPRLAPGER